ncbi:enoyl-CoA hydratase/isomerase family protein [Pseudonocardia xinjiangensis]|uniref:enoyl-CoA hydratase/isomerase family protein n=1 Tax=Pseudonocardia xinjiangensis TaxID=75289 RepID=UPI003D8C3987
MTSLGGDGPARTSTAGGSQVPPSPYFVSPAEFQRVRMHAGGTAGICWITLDRPERLNAFDWRMLVELRAALWEATYDDGIRVVVITGAGRGFSAGRDINDLRWQRGLPGNSYRSFVRTNHSTFDDIETIEKPVIAAVNGPCAGGGVELAVSCDFRIAAQEATFSLPEINIGVIPASGACSRMSRLIGVERLKEMVMTGRQYTAAQAAAMGLVSEVVPGAELVATVEALAADLMTGAPRAIGLAKHVINMCEGVDPHTGRDIERLGQSWLAQSDDSWEGLSAFLDKRSPDFRG